MVSDWLTLLGMVNVTETRTGARCDCPFHDGAGGQTFSVFGLRFCCFSASCGISGTLRGLAKHFGTTLPDWVASYQLLIQRREDPEEIPLYTIANLPLATEFMLKRGLPEESAAQWEVRIDDENHGILIPIFDHEGRFVSRMWRRNSKKMKYQNEADMPREQLLYGLNSLIAEGRHEHVYLLEGVGDVWKSRLSSIPSVGTYGANLCQGQIELMVNVGVKRATFMYDNDLAGWKGAIIGHDVACDTLAVDFAMNYRGRWPKDPGDGDEVCLTRLAKQRESFVEFYSRTVQNYGVEVLTEATVIR